MAEPKPPSNSAALRGRLLIDEPMAAHTSWRVGGPADRYFEPADRADLRDFIRALPGDEPVLWLGLGSNLLVRDGGFRGSVIALHGALDDLSLQAPDSFNDAPRVIAEAGVHCARLAKFSERRQLAGLGFMAGIPGTVGGALAMNAGAWGGETWNAVLEAEVVLRDGSTHWLTPAAFTIGYRSVVPPAQFLGFLGARFRVTADDGSHALATRASLAQRKATQPVGRPSAGSTFRNPPGDHAARLIEASGLKGARIGGAQVSMLHANFIVTDAAACAADVEALIAHIRNTVKQRTGVELHPEVKMVGEAVHA
ncbi:MAG: UDP-N-acetylmuramate dehydrogenase [Nevskia sp.]|nr:UDP-N-acetylmuramate dehydrogenase [Nevskia sp.]